MRHSFIACLWEQNHSSILIEYTNKAVGIPEGVAGSQGEFVMVSE